MKEQLHFQPGESIGFQGQCYTVLRVSGDLSSVTARNTATGIVGCLPLHEVTLPPDASAVRLPVVEELRPTQLARAQRRAEALRVLQECHHSLSAIDEVAATYKVHRSTIYRWMNRWNETGRVSSLANRPSQGGKGGRRLNSQVEALMQEVIEAFFLTKQRRTVKQTHLELRAQCAQKLGVKAPCLNTLQARINSINGRERVRRRHGARAAAEAYDPLRGSLDSPGPLEIVQVDHTVLDIVLVDELDRATSIGRPWITVAMDVYSRMVLGFHVSFDPPGAMGTGLCLAHAILPKEAGLKKLGIEGEWPCWGVPRMLHLDNAREFRGTMLKAASQEYGFKLEWRFVGKPEYGGHIERLMGTLLHEIHTLPGTTFSNPQERGSYNSEARAVLTLSELEVWLTRHFVCIYHQRFHTGIKTTPVQQFLLGTTGGEGAPAPGPRPRLLDERRLRLDFMPFVQRAIQDCGVVIDHIHYQADVLIRWIGQDPPHNELAYNNRGFIFKRDPRDISRVHFWDPDLREYFMVPYRNPRHPAMSIWQYREAVRMLKERGKPINEALIFEARRQQQAVVDNARRLTNAARRERNRRPIENILQAPPPAPAPPAPALELQAPSPARPFRPFTDLRDGPPASKL